MALDASPLVYLERAFKPLEHTPSAEVCYCARTRAHEQTQRASPHDRARHRPTRQPQPRRQP